MSARSRLTLVLLFSAACATEDVSGPIEPRVTASAVAANPDNVLGAIVTAQVSLADSVVVQFGLRGGELDSVSAAVASGGADAVIPVLGLLPGQPYSFRVVAFRGTEAATGQLHSFTTGNLPDDLPRYQASGTNPAPGFVAFAAGAYGLVIDNSGRVVWYHRFPDGPGLNFMPQPNGRYLARPATPDPSDRDPWVEIDVLGRVTRTLGCARGLMPRFHDLIIQPDESWWLMCDETRTMDLSGHGGVAGAQVTGTVVQHVGVTGALLFEWNPFDHFAITDLDSASRSGATVNWTHGNALDLGADGTLVVSFRSLSEVAGIDTRTGTVLWRLGGSRNQFTFVGTASPPFARQHGVRLTPGGLLLLDNLGDPNGSRAERYELDRVSWTARLALAYTPSAPVVALLGGTTQPMAEGHTLVAFGNGGRVEEYDESGRVVWQILGNPGYVFRAQRIRSLYAPGAEDAR